MSFIVVEPKFSPGRVVRHLKFGYRGVVVDIDPTFAGTDEWYETVARSRPPKDQPWYHVLVHGATHRTYVAERHLAADDSDEPIDHPDLIQYFDEHDGDMYRRARTLN